TIIIRLASPLENNDRLTLLGLFRIGRGAALGELDTDLPEVAARELSRLLARGPGLRHRTRRHNERFYEGDERIRERWLALVLLVLECPAHRAFFEGRWDLDRLLHDLLSGARFTEHNFVRGAVDREIASRCPLVEVALVDLLMALLGDASNK